MDVMAARYRSNDPYSSPGELEVLVDHIPKDEEMVWHFWPHGRGVFLAELDGAIKFYCHDGSDRNLGGFGGGRFDLPMDDGTVKTVYGPWSGDTYMFWNAPLDRPIAPIKVVAKDLSYQHDIGMRWEDWLGFGGVYITFDYAFDILEAFLPDYEWIIWDDNYWWVPHHRVEDCEKRYCPRCGVKV